MHLRLPALIAVAVTLALPATALADQCGEQSSWKAFSRWGDDGDYFVAPGGLFDQGLQWEATGAATLVADDNPYADTGDATSAALSPRATLTSPPICITRAHQYLRYVARATGTKSHLQLEVLYADDHGKPKRTPVGDLDDKHYGSWGLSKKVDIKKVLPRDENIRSIQLRFVVPDGQGTWLVDNVFVDPVKNG